MSTQQAERYQQVAATIKQQIGPMTLARVGASGFYYTSQESGGLVFDARLQRRGGSQVRLMRVAVALNGRDLYDVRVTHTRGGRGAHRYDLVEHYQASDVDAENLSGVIAGLDRDGRNW